MYSIGLHAAYTLANNRITDVVILEAQDRIGGRIYSRDINNNWIEEGALNGSTEKNPLCGISWWLMRFSSGFFLYHELLNANENCSYWLKLLKVMFRIFAKLAWASNT